MAWYIVKIIITALIIVIVSEISKRLPLLGSLIASLPLISVLGMIWIFQETKNSQKLISHAEGTFWYVMLDPLFEPTTNVQHTDYLWLNIWGNKEDKDSGYARYAETDLQAQADMFSTCQRFPHSGRVIR